MADEVTVIVIDLGSGCVRAGFAGDDAPRVALPNVVGRPKYPCLMVGMGQRSQYIGDEAICKRGVLNITYPMEHGVVQNWDQMDKIFDHLYKNELRCAASNGPTLITEHVFNPKRNRERLLECLFESHSSPAVFVEPPELLHLYCSSQTGGTAVSVGDGVMSTMQFIDGYKLPHCSRVDIGGRDLTRYLATMLADRGLRLDSTAGLDVAREIKEKLSFVAEDFWELTDIAEQSSSINMEYVLPDGNSVTVGSERFRCMEPLFDPSLIGVESPGIHELILQNAQKADKDNTCFLWGGVFLGGAGAMAPGFAARLRKELDARLVGRCKSRIINLNPMAEGAWIGGSIIGSLSTFQKMWISRAEYDEDGPSIGHRKCI